MQQIYHRNLKIPNLFVPYEPDYDSFVELPLEKSKINSEFLVWLEDLNLSFDSASRFFNSIPFQRYGLHADYSADDPHDHCIKLNLIYDSSGTMMSWWKVKEGYQGDLRNNYQNEMVRYYDRKHCGILHLARTDQHCLINGGIIHSMFNSQNHGRKRKCYSFALVDKNSGERITWEQSIQIFNHYIVDR